MNMNLCSDGHGEVCYSGINCPACEEITSLKQQLEDKESNLSAMDAKCDKLADEVESLKVENSQLRGI